MSGAAAGTPAEVARPWWRSRVGLARLATVALGALIWFWPVPEGLTAAAWHLFALFAAAIFAVIVGALPILTASVLALGAAVLSGTVPAAKTYAAFGNATILLIVLAFLVARAVVTCGLGQRLGHAVVALFGRSTLGLGYSIFLVDGVIAPAFPSNTARGGVLFPLALSVCEAAGVKPGDPARARMGRFLMFSGIASLTLSSGLWFTAMAANPLAAEIARTFGIEIGFGSWLLAACVPTLFAMALLPFVLYRVIGPEVRQTPEAPAAARRELARLGPLTRGEKIVAVTFVVMVALWALAGTFGLDTTAVAFLGLGTLLATKVLTLQDLAQEGDVLVTYLWFAALYAMSDQLNQLGFMSFLGQRLAGALGGLPWLAAFLVLAVAYVLLHYLFVSQTAHVLALLGVFLEVGIKLGVPPALLAFQLAFASNYFSAIAPQGSSANLLFAQSGYLQPAEMYRLGALTTGLNFLVYIVLGTPWLLLVAR